MGAERVGDHVDELETRLGSAADADNPLGFRAVVAADERGEMLSAGERMLDEYVLNAEFVPRSLGGRFGAADRLATTLRAVFRRDPVLGLGYGVSSFIGAAPVWAAGSAGQRRWVADLLLENRRIAAAYTELAHGGDFSHASLQAVQVPNGFLLSGGKQLISNAARAQALTVFARTGAGPGSRSHSHLLVDTASMPPGTLRRARRFTTSGARGLLLGGIEFLDCPVPMDSLVGELGGAMETVLEAFQVTRCVLPGMAVGILDTQLRLAARFAVERVLYGRSAADLPQVRSLLVGAFVDLLICDCMATVAARALHALPGQSSVYAAAVKYFVPSLLLEANYRLSTLLGARSYVREGPYAIFQKNGRDLSVAMLAHASSAACLATMIAQLPRLARQSWLRAEPPPSRLFRLEEPLPDFDFSMLELSARGQDNLSAVVVATADGAGVLSTEPGLTALCAEFRAQLSDLRAQCAALAPRDRTVAAGPAAFEIAQRYATVLAANACVGIWQHNQRNQGHGSGFLPDPSWVIAALSRLAERLGAPASLTGMDGIERRLFTEVRERLDDGRALDLSAERLAG